MKRVRKTRAAWVAVLGLIGLQPGFSFAQQAAEPADFWETEIKIYSTIWQGLHPSQGGKQLDNAKAESIEFDAYLALWIGDDGIPYIQVDNCIAALFPAQPGVTLETGGQFVADLAYAGSPERCGLADGEEIVYETRMLMPQSGGFAYSYASDHTITDPYRGWGRMFGSAMLLTSSSEVSPQTFASAGHGSADSSPQTGSSDLAAVIDKVIRADSSGWLFNRYDRGSVTNATFLEKSEDGESGVAYGEYTYNGGRAGWIKIVMQDGAVECMEYWDFAGRCRPFGTASYGSQLAMDLTVAAMSAPPTYGGGSGSGENCREVVGGLDPNGRPIVLGYECN